MNAARRATAILTDPYAEWPRIEQEQDDAAYLISRYVALLALVPALASFVGACIIGVVVPGVGNVRAGLFDGLFGAIFGYVLSCATVVVLGLIIAILAPLFGGRRHFESALKLAAYSYTPVWLAGIFLLLPGLRFLMLTGFYGVYILAIGLPRLTKSRSAAMPGFGAAIVACAALLTALGGVAQQALFGSPGL